MQQPGHSQLSSVAEQVKRERFCMTVLSLHNKNRICGFAPSADDPRLWTQVQGSSPTRREARLHQVANRVFYMRHFSRTNGDSSISKLMQLLCRDPAHPTLAIARVACVQLLLSCMLAVDLLRAFACVCACADARKRFRAETAYTRHCCGFPSIPPDHVPVLVTQLPLSAGL